MSVYVSGHLNMIRTASRSAVVGSIVFLGCYGMLDGLAQTVSGPPAEVGTQDIRETNTSLTERALASMRRPVGMSIGFMELSAPDFSMPGSGNKSTTFAMLQPRIFAMRGTGKAHFQLDYTLGYRSNNRNRQIHSTEHSASMGFGYRLSRNVSLQVSESFRSTVDDNGVLPTSTTPAIYEPNFAQALYMPHTRTTTNSVITSIGYHPSKRANISVSMSYDTWHYSESSFGGTSGIQVGIRSDYQINKWLFFNNSYSHYLNAVSTELQTASIHRLKLGGFKFKLGRTLELAISGGVDSTHFQGAQRTNGSVESGLSKTSRSTKLTLLYHHGLYSTVGEQDAMGGNTLSLTLTQGLSKRASFQVSSGYTRGVSLSKDSKLRYISGNGELQVAVQKHIMWSTQLSYVSQAGVNLSPGAAGLSQITASMGLHFFLPPLGGRRAIPR